MSNSKNINSFAENMRKTITAQTNQLTLLESMQEAITTNDTFVTYDYTKLKDGSVNTYQLPSFTSLDNRLKAIEVNLQNLASGNASLTLTDGSRRQLKLTSLPKTPARIATVQDPSLFNIDTNWFFEDLMFPGLTVKVDLTGQIDDDSDRVKVSRIILDANNAETQQFWNNTLATNTYEYASLKALLAYNNISYSEDIETIQLPLVSNSLTGSFLVVADPEIINGNTWYTVDKLSYTSINENGTDLGTNNILSIGDKLAYNDSLYEVVGVDQNSNKVRLKILTGSSFPGVYSIFQYYQDPFRSKEVSIRVGAHEYDIIYIKGVNEDFNLLANDWSTPIKFSTDELVKDDDINTTLKQFYATNVVDWGAEWIAQAKERNLSAYYGHIPNKPTLNASDLRVVQINTQVNAALDKADLKNLASDIESKKSLIESLQLTIAAQQTELQSITSADKYKHQQEDIARNTTDLKNLQAQYNTLVNQFQTAVQLNQAVVENPKYHIRGFFPIPLNKYRDDEEKIPEEIIGFDIAYRYICEDDTATQLNTFTYTDTTNQSISQGTFTDWIIEQSKIRQRVWNNTTGMFEWQSENVADGSEVNINQIDIAITKGEKVEIKVRTISEAGYPNNPLKSEWSDSVVIAFPDNLDTKNAMAELVEEVNDDALNITINNNLDALGVNSHLDDTIANTNSVNGIYFKHKSENIAFEDMDEGSNSVSSISLQDKVADLEARLSLLENYLNNLIAAVNEVIIATQTAYTNRI